PVMMGMFYATMRAVTTVYGSFMGMPLSETPLQGFQNLQWGPITVYVLMIVMSLLQMQLPKWLSKLSGKDKPKNYADRKAEENNPMASTMNMTMYMTTGLIAFMYISWPIAMSFYWLVSSIIRAGTTVLSHFVSEKEMKKREAEEAAKRSTGILKNRKGKK
ncbi:MAG: preprotein translocase YidC, partial [Allobaculum sp.]|nr:preprotein translocase YidC [Allobaculum sp.]